MISIAKCDYDYLLKRNGTLSALEAAGVENWAGYDNAMAALTESAA